MRIYKKPVECVVGILGISVVEVTHLFCRFGITILCIELIAECLHFRVIGGAQLIVHRVRVLHETLRIKTGLFREAVGSLRGGSAYRVYFSVCDKTQIGK